ncbi:hypothetical protein [Microtetraspora sp. NBRC 16547]|uniref:hypothetical protein n=1 Tax=Microtetraspora sp. NBRC 16547 TaxID=3030993 RepID=UPI0024A21FD9|nr:hypothetical protein [Microtetraspora sp. NBRC 16547]GLX00863.1 hypothetical protein Misp02_49490 [Microtetraspora sp. NBRC 16547]
MHSELQIAGFLIGVSAGLFLLITVLVLALGRPAKSQTVSEGVVWFGGPGRSEHGADTSVLVLTGRPPHWLPYTDVQWTALARDAEPRARTGGASAGW